jgi:hypothetical protein
MEIYPVTALEQERLKQKRLKAETGSAGSADAI